MPTQSPDGATRKGAGAVEAWAAAQEALPRCRRLLEKGGDARKAQAASITFGVLVDKRRASSARPEAGQQRQAS